MMLFCHKHLALLYVGHQRHLDVCCLNSFNPFDLMLCWAEFLTSHTVNEARFMSRYTMSKHCCSFQFQYYTSFSDLNLNKPQKRKISRAQILSILLQIAFVFFNTWGEAKCQSFRKLYALSQCHEKTFGWSPHHRM